MKPNLQLFVTRRCQLRCRYCPVAKGSATMSAETARLGAELLLTHRSPRLRLDFGGGEPLLNFEVVKETAAHAARRARALGKDLRFYMVTNALLLDDAVLEWARERGVLLELSLDGAREDHNRFKAAHARGVDPYAATRAGVERAVRSGTPHFVIMVASPANVRRLAVNFEHLLDLGARSIDISYAIGGVWSPEDADAFFAQVRTVLERHAGPIASGEIVLGNAAKRVEPTLLNSELMVDTDGSLHQMSEWMFETTAPTGPAPFPLGRVEDARDMNALSWSRFRAHYTLLRMHGGDPAVRAAVLNNIEFGLRAGRFFEAERGRLGRVPA